MDEETTSAADPVCAICERRLLVGERASRFVKSDGVEVTVCELCKPRAEAGGWLRPGEVPSGNTAGGRRRQRVQLLESIRRRVDRERRSRDRPEGGEQRPAPERDAERSDPSEARRGAIVRRTVGPDLDEAIAAFNAGGERRMVAGLNRSLGDPRASGHAVRTAAGANGARITVAWELAWYQWEVGPGERGPEIRQKAKGETLDQLRAADRNWNLEVGDDGSLSRREGEAGA